MFYFNTERHKTKNLQLFFIGHPPAGALLAEQVPLPHSPFPLSHVWEIPPRSALLRLKAEVSLAVFTPGKTSSCPISEKLSETMW